jgi:hypothetical protein
VSYTIVKTLAAQSRRQWHPAPGGFTRRLDSRDDQRHQHTDDRHDDEQLDESES